jgi:hypothetical protein
MKNDIFANAALASLAKFGTVAPLIVTMDNVIIRLMLSVLKRTDQLSKSS